ncbi:MAG TPA: hypothetical protein VHO70_05670 [Chitinispirillaceae bacterium]|nr:hypothetical protein [Chitinispirillaceae bacterium]
MPIDGVESTGMNRIEKRRDLHRTNEALATEDEKTRSDRADVQTRATRGVKESGLGKNMNISF